MDSKINNFVTCEYADLTHIIICEYLGSEDCRTYLEYIDQLKEFEYMYKTYDIDHEKVDMKKVRYGEFFFLNKLYEYPNIISFKLSDSSRRDKIHPNTIPPWIKYVELSYAYCRTIVPGAFMEGIEYINFGECYNKILQPKIFPSTLKKLVLDGLFNQIFKKNVLSEGLEELILSGDYNKKIKLNVLPKTLIKLHLGNKYDKAFRPHIFPKSLKELTIDSEYSHNIIKNVLPKSLEKFICPLYRCDPNITCVLPSYLIELRIFSVYQMKLPPSLKILSTSLQHMYDANISYNLEELILYDIQSVNITIQLTNLKKLDLSSAHISEDQTRTLISPNLTTLILNYDSKYDLKNIIPTNLKKLKLGNKYDKQIRQFCLTNTIEILIFGEKFDQFIKYNTLPSMLKYLKFDKYYNMPIDPYVLPGGLEVLIFGEFYDKQFNINVLPPSLKILILGKQYNQEFKQDILPSNLIKLVLHEHFNQDLYPKTMPNSLEYIIFGNTFNKKIEKNVFSTSLKKITFGNNYDISDNTQVNFNQSLQNIPKSVKTICFLGNELHFDFKQNIIPNFVKNINIKTNDKTMKRVTTVYPDKIRYDYNYTIHEYKDDYYKI